MTPASIALSRFGYGLGPRDTAPHDPRGWLLGQLDRYDPNPAAIAKRTRANGDLGETLGLLRSLRRDTREMAAKETMMAEMSRDDAREAALANLPPKLREKYADARGVLVQDVALRVNLAVSSPTPLMERLVHFWSNHFSVSVGKLGTQVAVGDHEFTAIRPHVLGRFGDMLEAAALHPAMLLYLDQFQSVGPNSPMHQRRGRRAAQPGQQGRRGLNENLAREILELHTLGVGGGYSQADVTEFARALTGWTVPGVGRADRLGEEQPNGAVFVAAAHESGARRLLGRSYTAGAADQARAILRDLAVHPATARFIATKLARHFAGDTPPPALVTRLEADFVRTGGDLASLTRTLIEAPEGWAPGPLKFRTPFEWLVASLRLTGNDTMPPRRIVAALNQLGHVPWRAPSPAGYDDVAASWAGPDALLRRVELAGQLARDASIENVAARADAAFPGALSDATRTQLARAESGKQALALLLVSPEMLRR